MNKAKLFILLMLLVAGNAQAQDLRVGVQAGHSTLTGDLEGFSLDASSTAARVYVGWQFSQSVGIEFGYQDFGNFEQSLAAGLLSVDADGFTLALTGTIPVNDAFSFQGRLGSFFWDGNAGINHVTQASPGDTNLFVAVGARYQITEQFSVIGEWTYYDLDQPSARVLGIGAEFHF